MTAKWDLALTNRGRVKVWNAGFFEHMNGLSLADMPELIEIGDYRMVKREFESHKDLFLKAMSGNQKSSAFRIRELREKTGLSQTAFGQKYGIPMRTVQNWETGASEAPAYVINLLERAVREDTQKTVELRERRMGDLFEETGCEEIWSKDLYDEKRDSHFSASDFAEGGKMEKFADYKVWRFEHEFGCTVWIG